MSARIVPVDPATAEGKSKELLTIVKSQFGMVPNTLKTMAHSPALLEGYLGLSSALSHGLLPALIREQIALIVSQTNSCGYCLSAHTLTGKRAGLSADQVIDARKGIAQDPKAQSAITLAKQIMEKKGHISAEEFTAAKQAGLSDGEIAEVIGHVTLLTLTNYLNEAVQVDIDFPKVSPTLA